MRAAIYLGNRARKIWHQNSSFCVQRLLGLSECRFGNTNFCSLVVKDEARFETATWDTILIRCGRALEWENCLSMLSELQGGGLPFSVAGINATASACAKAAKWEVALLLLADIGNLDLQPSTATYSIATRTAGDASLWEAGLHLMFEARKVLNLDAVAYGAALRACKGGAFWQGCIAILAELHGCNHGPDMFHMSSAIHVCGIARRWDKSLALLHSLLQGRLRGLPGVVSFNAAINSCEIAMKWEYAVNILHEMRRITVRPDAVSFGIVIRAFTKNKRWSDALAVVVEAQRDKISLDLISINAALSTCAKTSQWVHATALFASSSSKPNHKTFDALLEAYEGASRWDQVLSLIDDMRRISVGLHASTFRRASSACRRARQWQVSLLISREARHQGLQSSLASYTTAISACERGSQWEQGCALLCEMLERCIIPDVFSYSAAQSTCAKSARWEVGLDLLHSMQGRLVTPNTVCYNATINACGRGGQWERGLWLLYEMAERHVERDIISYNSAISACETGGQSGASLSLFENAITCGFSPDIFTCSITINSCRHNAMWETALSLVRSMSSFGLQPDVYSLGAAVTACARGAQIPQSVDLLGQMQNARLGPDVASFGATAVACDRGGFWSWTLELLERMQQQIVQPDMVCLSSAVCACARARQMSLLPELLQTCKKHAHKLLQLLGADHNTAIAVDLFRRFGKPDAEIEATFRSQVFMPVQAELRRVVFGDGCQTNAMLRKWRLHSTFLEEQFGLGACFTQEALQDLGIAGSRCPVLRLQTREKWHAISQKDLVCDLQRKCQAMGIEVPVEPVARVLNAWLRYKINSYIGGDKTTFQGEKVVGYGQHPLGATFLLPLFIQHGRAAHAERHALLQVIASLGFGEKVPLEASSAQELFVGHVWLFASHTPCLSCLAVFCQFRQLLPNVQLHVAFSDWLETRHEVVAFPK